MRAKIQKVKEWHFFYFTLRNIDSIVIEIDPKKNERKSYFKRVNATFLPIVTFKQKNYSTFLCSGSKLACTLFLKNGLIKTDILEFVIRFTTLKNG